MVRGRATSDIKTKIKSNNIKKQKMNKFMISKFKSTCHETGNVISKGEHILYDTASRKAYCSKSQKYKAEKECEQTAAYIQAQEDAYFDNLCYKYGI